MLTSWSWSLFMFCLPLWFWLPKNVNNLGPKSHGNHWLRTRTPLFLPRSVSETAGSSTTTLHFIPLCFFMQHITLLQSDDCCGFTFRIVLRTSCGFFSPLNAASCLHWSFSSKTLAHFDCRLDCGFVRVSFSAALTDDLLKSVKNCLPVARATLARFCFLCAHVTGCWRHCGRDAARVWSTLDCIELRGILRTCWIVLVLVVSANCPHHPYCQV